MFGNADEFWRIRLTRVDTADHFDFEWHDDILYRAPVIERADEVEYFHVEAVRLDDPEDVVRVATFDDPDQAKDLVVELKEALAQMSKSQFESAYLEGAEPGDTGVE
jgi:hypothetical protein